MDIEWEVTDEDLKTFEDLSRLKIKYFVKNERGCRYTFTTL